MIFVEMGNLHPKDVDRPTITEWTLQGETIASAGYTLSECVVSCHGDWVAHSVDAQPAWIVANVPELEAALVGGDPEVEIALRKLNLPTWSCPIGKPADVNDRFLTRENAPEGARL